MVPKTKKKKIFFNTQPLLHAVGWVCDSAFFEGKFYNMYHRWGGYGMNG